MSISDAESDDENSLQKFGPAEWACETDGIVYFGRCLRLPWQMHQGNRRIVLDKAQSVLNALETSRPRFKKVRYELETDIRSVKPVLMESIDAASGDIMIHVRLAFRPAKATHVKSP
jgi:hypothetical protein